MKETEENVANRREEEFKTELSTSDRPNERLNARSELPYDINFFECPKHGTIRGTACPYCHDETP